MKLPSLDRPVTSAWLNLNGRRLDSSPYVSGAAEAKVLLSQLAAKTKPLQELTLGGKEGLINAGRIARTWVDDPAYGIPFLSSTDILQADLSNVSLITKKAVQPNPRLIIREGWTLITRSGSIGRMAYCRPDMSGMACTEDVLRVVPDPNKILPGYLYAYLSSRFGVPQVIGGTYGTIIQHIEPHHIEDLPVPIAPEEVQESAHNLVVEAAALRAEANTVLTSSIRELEEIMKLPHLPARTGKSGVSIVSSNTVTSRLNALFHSRYHLSALGPLLELPEACRTTVGTMSSAVVEPPRFKRSRVDTPEYGIPFFGTTALMWADPVPVYHVSNAQQYRVDEKTLLVPRSGQLGGIIGQVVLPYGNILGGAASEHAIRIIADSQMITGYLFIALSSEYGRRQLKARAFGSSIPSLDIREVRETIIPRPADETIEDLGNRGLAVARSRGKAIEKEHLAREIVEKWIAANNAD
jgi:type I restriction enzyme S subunit